MRKLKLMVDEANLVQNQRFAFTNRHTVLAELMQNARRAGAAEVKFDFIEEGNQLVVVDNGAGVQDLQNLLFVAKSGWDEDLKAEEHPFGMGFMSALFAAKHVKVESRGHAIEFDTDHVLQFGEIDETRSDFIGGTRITMTGFGMDGTDIKTHLDGYAKGFPIDVYFGGEVLESPEHMNDAMLDTAIGKVKLGSTNNWALYLQGLPVNRGYRRLYNEADTCIIHLDSWKFHARMPDRDTLLDFKEAEKEIHETIRQTWRAVMEAEKAAIGADEGYVAFAEKYWEIAKSFRILDIMNDVPYLPKDAFRVIAHEPQQSSWGYSHSGKPKSGYWKRQVEAGEVKLCDNVANYLDGKNFVPSIFAWKQGWCEINPGLPEGHWVEKHVIDLDNVDVDLELVGDVTEGSFAGHFVSADLHLCQSYRITVNGETATITDHAVCYGEDAHDCVIVVPAETSGLEALDQASDYLNDDIYQEGDRDEDGDALRKQVSVLRGEDPAVTLSKVMTDGNLASFDNVLGKVFLVKTRQRTEEHRWSFTDDVIINGDSFLQTLKDASAKLAEMGEGAADTRRELDELLLRLDQQQ